MIEHVDWEIVGSLLVSWFAFWTLIWLCTRKTMKTEYLIATAHMFHSRTLRWKRIEGGQALAIWPEAKGYQTWDKKSNKMVYVPDPLKPFDYCITTKAF